MPTKVDALTERIKNIKTEQKTAVAMIVEKTSMTVGASLLGMYDGYVTKEGKRMPQTVGPVPVKVIFAALAYTGAALTKGKLSRAFQGVGDAATSIYEYKVTRAISAGETTNVFVQGQD